LKAIKLKILECFRIFPLQQRIYYKSKLLDNDEFTLAQYGIIPDTLLLVKEEKISNDSQDELTIYNTTETGFKGTGLLGMDWIDTKDNLNENEIINTIDDDDSDNNESDLKRKKRKLDDGDSDGVTCNTE